MSDSYDDYPLLGRMAQEGPLLSGLGVEAVSALAEIDRLRAEVRTAQEQLAHDPRCQSIVEQLAAERALHRTVMERIDKAIQLLDECVDHDLVIEALWPVTERGALRG